MSSPFQSKNKLSAIVQQASLKRSGLVADCIFPPIKTPCRFDYIDWTKAANIKVVEDAVGCKTDVREVDPEAFTLVSAKVEDHALQQSMGDCCVTACGDDAAYAAKKEAGKGTWLNVWSGTDQSNENVQLKVLAGTAEADTEYTSTINWELADAPK